MASRMEVAQECVRAGLRSKDKLKLPKRGLGEIHGFLLRESLGEVAASELKLTPPSAGQKKSFHFGGRIAPEP